MYRVILYMGMVYSYGPDSAWPAWPTMSMYPHGPSVQAYRDIPCRGMGCAWAIGIQGIPYPGRVWLSDSDPGGGGRMAMPPL